MTDPFVNAKNKNTRLDFEFDMPMTLQNWLDMLTDLPKQHFWAGADRWYKIKQIHSVIIYPETNRNTNKIEVTVYMQVDTGERVIKTLSNSF